MASFRVPREDQQKVLLFGIVFSLIARTGFIFLGAALINSFAWVFYLFGLILLLTAGNMLKPERRGVARRRQHHRPARAAGCSAPPTTTTATSCSPIEDGKRVMTPMLLVMVAIGGTDILFALDSIPAIFGLTQNVFIVFTATAFSLLGLRQLYFLIDGLLDRLIYLSYGLAAILGVHRREADPARAAREQRAVHQRRRARPRGRDQHRAVAARDPRRAGRHGRRVAAQPRGRAQNAIANARRHATAYLDSEYTDDPAERERIFQRCCAERDQIIALGPKYRQKVRDEAELMALLERARDSHDAAVARGEAARAGPPRLIPPSPAGNRSLCPWRISPGKAAWLPPRAGGVDSRHRQGDAQATAARSGLPVTQASSHRHGDRFWPAFRWCVLRAHHETVNERIETGSIVVAVDGSEHADRAVEWAAEQAQLENRPLVAVNAREWDSVRVGGWPESEDGEPLAQGSNARQRPRRRGGRRRPRQRERPWGGRQAPGGAGGRTVALVDLARTHTCLCWVRVVADRWAACCSGRSARASPGRRPARSSSCRPQGHGATARGVVVGADGTQWSPPGHPVCVRASLAAGAAADGPARLLGRGGCGRRPSQRTARRRLNALGCGGIAGSALPVGRGIHEKYPDVSVSLRIQHGLVYYVPTTPGRDLGPGGGGTAPNGFGGANTYRGNRYCRAGTRTQHGRDRPGSRRVARLSRHGWPSHTANATRAITADAASAGMPTVRRSARSSSGRYRRSSPRTPRVRGDQRRAQGAIHCTSCDPLGGGSVYDLTSLTTTFECIAVNEKLAGDQRAAGASLQQPTGTRAVGAGGRKLKGRSFLFAHRRVTGTLMLARAIRATTSRELRASIVACRPVGNDRSRLRVEAVKRLQSVRPPSAGRGSVGLASFEGLDQTGCDVRSLL